MSIYKGLLISKDRSWSEELLQLVSEENIEISVVSEWKRTFREQQSYHYIFVDIDTIENPQQIPMSSSSIVLGLTRNYEFEQARTWLVAGAKDVIVLPGEKNRLLEALKASKEQFKFQKETEMGYGNGQVHAFYSAKGGSGKTLLASLMAQSLSIHHGFKVLLIDLNAQFGNADVLFGIQPVRSYFDLIPVMDEMDIRHLQNVSNYHEETKVTLLTGPANPAKAESIPDELIGRLIRVAKSHYDYIILDLPPHINNSTFTGLNEANHIHYILTPDSLGLRAFKYSEDLFERFQIGRGGEVSVLINRYHPKLELTLKDMEKIIGREVNGSIESDFFSIQPFINMGEGFYKKKKDKGSNKVSKSMKKYVDEMQNRTKG